MFNILFAGISKINQNLFEYHQSFNQTDPRPSGNYCTKTTELRKILFNFPVIDKPMEVDEKFFQLRKLVLKMNSTEDNFSTKKWEWNQLIFDC